MDEPVKKFLKPLLLPNFIPQEFAHKGNFYLQQRVWHAWVEIDEPLELLLDIVNIVSKVNRGRNLPSFETHEQLEGNRLLTGLVVWVFFLKILKIVGVAISGPCKIALSASASSNRLAIGRLSETLFKLVVLVMTPGLVSIVVGRAGLLSIALPLKASFWWISLFIVAPFDLQELVMLPVLAIITEIVRIAPAATLSISSDAVHD